MESHEDDYAKVSAAVALMLGVLDHLKGLLQLLPLPVELPEFRVYADEDPNALEVVTAIQRARALIQEEPISGLRKRAYDKLAVQWLIIYELTAMTIVGGPAPWRIDGIEYASGQFGMMAEMIENGDLDALDALEAEEDE